MTLNFAEIHAVVIDLDGTLLDTAADLAAAANAVRVDAGLPELPSQRIVEFVGRGADVLIHRTLTDSPDGEVDAEQFAQSRAAFDVHYDRENGVWAKPFPGVLVGLRKIQSLGLPMVCVTNKPQRFAEPLLEQHGMAEFFSLTLGGDALARKKPDPLPLVHAAQSLSLSPSQCLMVGDSGNDAIAARAAAMPVLILPYGYNEGRPVQALDCDGIVDSIEEIAGLLSAAGAQPANQ
jgi:phosphoglycolate phosphatase